MGVVYLAKDPRLERRVAVKVLPEAMSSDADRLRRFEREAKTLARVNHANIAAIYALEEAGGHRMLVMEYVAGQHLGERIEAVRAAAGGRDGLSVEETLRLAVQMAAGLEAAHADGVVHRDLKPANIRVRADGVVKVLDFGLAKPEAGAFGEGADDADTVSFAGTEVGRVLGTAGYLSPEQARGRAVDKRADLWGFGCVVFECLAGVRAFEGETAMDAIVSVLERSPPWERLPPGTPPRLIELLRRCLEKDVERRARDIGDVRVQLEDALSQLIGGADAGGVGAARGLAPMHAAAVGVAGVAGVGGAMGGVGGVGGVGDVSATGMGLGIGSRVSMGSGSGSGVAGFATPTNLKSRLTRFVGRGLVLGEIDALLADRRLLTLTGPPGCGKTRLAVEAATRASGAFKDGVWLVELDELSPEADAGAVAAKAAAVVGVEASRLGDAITGTESLVILDNCEHVLAGAAGFAGAVLNACPRVKVLATGRESLGVPGETVLGVAPMAVPPEGADAGTLAMTESVELFVDRARAVRPRFGLSADNAELVGAICRALDGLPLAIELAAARVKLLSVEQIAERLGQPFKLLRGGGKGLSERQRSLHDAIAWSFDRLEGAERAALRRLGVIPGSFTLGAAEHVCAGEYAEEATPGDLNDDAVLEEWEVIDLLGPLLDKSLLDVEEDGEGGEPRYRMLETVRRFALSRLDEAGEGQVARDRLLAFAVGVVEGAQRAAETGEIDEAGWFGRLSAEAGVVRAALRWVLEGGGDLDLGRRVGAASWRWAWWSGGFGEMRAMLRRLDASGRGGEPTGAWAGVREGMCWSAVQAGDLAGAIACGLSGLEMARGLGLGDGAAAAGLLSGLGAACLDEEQPDRARDYFEQALAMRKRAGGARGAEGWRVAEGVRALGECRRVAGDFEGARALYREAAGLVACDGVTRAMIGLGLGWVSLAEGDLGAARDHAEAGLEMVVAMNALGAGPGPLELAASVASAEGTHGRAVTLFASADAARDAFGSPPRASERRDFAPWLERSFGALSTRELATARAAGLGMGVREAARFALAGRSVVPGES